MKPHEALRQVIDSHGLKRVDVATSCGMTADDLSKYLNGKRDLMGNRLISLIQALPLSAQVEFLVMVRESVGKELVTV